MTYNAIQHSNMNYFELPTYFLGPVGVESPLGLYEGLQFLLQAVDLGVERSLELGLTLLVVSLHRPLSVQLIMQTMYVTDRRLDSGH